MKENIQDRFQGLIEKAGNYDDNDMGRYYADCAGWLAAVSHILQITLPSGSPYRERAELIIDQYDNDDLAPCAAVQIIAAMLQHLVVDMENDLLESIIDRTKAETFDNFLDHAKFYFDENKKSESGVIAGVVFEDSIRSVCRKYSIPEKDQKLDDLISNLQKNGILTTTKAKRARAAAGVRTKATHAQWDEFDLEDVRSTIQLTEDLISNYLDK